MRLFLLPSCSFVFSLVQSGRWSIVLFILCYQSISCWCFSSLRQMKSQCGLTSCFPSFSLCSSLAPRLWSFCNHTASSTSSSRNLCKCILQNWKSVCFQSYVALFKWSLKLVQSLEDIRYLTFQKPSSLLVNNFFKWLLNWNCLSDHPQGLGNFSVWNFVTSELHSIQINCLLFSYDWYILYIFTSSL